MPQPAVAVAIRRASAMREMGMERGPAMTVLNRRDDTLPRSTATDMQAAVAKPPVNGDPMESMDLRKAGLKVTHPRMRILELLELRTPRQHMTAEDIYRQLLEQGDEIGLATVYRVLTQFEAAGVVVKHNFEGGHALYEIDRGDHHYHMVDVVSDQITEFESPEIVALLNKIAGEHGYVLDEHSLVLYVRKKR